LWFIRTVLLEAGLSEDRKVCNLVMIDVTKRKILPIISIP
jgi:hypothetical protein